MYFVSKIEERAGLKISQHTRANRKGPNMHQIVRTASGVIVGIYFEIDRDSEYSCTLNLIKSQLLLVTMQGGSLNDVSGLENTEFEGDRAYNKKMVSNVLVKAGADLNGTKPMLQDNPFVYGGN